MRQSGPGSGRPGDRKNVTQAPDRGRHPRGCRPRRRFWRPGHKWPQVFNLRNQPCADARPVRRRPCGRCGPPPPSRPPRFNPEKKRKRCQPPNLGNPDCERSLAPAQRGPGSGRPGDRKNVTQAPNRGRHQRGCHPRRRFLRPGHKLPQVPESGRRFLTCGISVCRLKTCTHFFPFRSRT